MNRPSPASLVLVALLGCACDPYAAWPDPTTVYPHVYTPQAGLENYEEVRWETETWSPDTDPGQAGLYLRKAQLHRPGAPEETVEHHRLMRPDLPPLGDGPVLSFVGDIMWVGENWDAFALPVADLLDGVRVGNLETPTDPASPTDLGDLPLYSFNAPPAMLDGLPFDVLQLNNNHALDVGEPGLEATLGEVAARGFTATGVDDHAVVEVDGLRVALLSYTWGLNGRGPAAGHELFVVPFGHEDVDLAPVVADIAAVNADTVVVLVHWGYEYEYYADPHFQVLARDLVSAGADLVVGQGPHVVQPAELCHVERPHVIPGIGTCSVRGDRERTAAVLYSLGNFATPQPTLPLQTGIVATVSLTPDGDVQGLGWAPVATTDIDGLRTVVPAEQVEGLAMEGELRRLEAHLGTSWRR